MNDNKVEVEDYLEIGDVEYTINVWVGFNVEPADPECDYGGCCDIDEIDYDTLHITGEDNKEVTSEEIKKAVIDYCDNSERFKERAITQLENKWERDYEEEQFAYEQYMDYLLDREREREEMGL